MTFLGLIFYIAIRCRTYQQTKAIQQTIPFVFVAISALTGLFSSTGQSSRQQVSGRINTIEKGI